LQRGWCHSTCSDGLAPVTNLDSLWGGMPLVDSHRKSTGAPAALPRRPRREIGRPAAAILLTVAPSQLSAGRDRQFLVLIASSRAGPRFNGIFMPRLIASQWLCWSSSEGIAAPLYHNIMIWIHISLVTWGSRPARNIICDLLRAAEYLRSHEGPWGVCHPVERPRSRPQGFLFGGLGSIINDQGCLLHLGIARWLAMDIPASVRILKVGFMGLVLIYALLLGSCDGGCCSLPTRIAYRSAVVKHVGSDKVHVDCKTRPVRRTIAAMANAMRCRCK